MSVSKTLTQSIVYSYSQKINPQSYKAVLIMYLIGGGSGVLHHKMF